MINNTPGIKKKKKEKLKLICSSATLNFHQTNAYFLDISIFPDRLQAECSRCVSFAETIRFDIEENENNKSLFFILQNIR